LRKKTVKNRTSRIEPSCVMLSTQEGGQGKTTISSQIIKSVWLRLKQLTEGEETKFKHWDFADQWSDGEIFVSSSDLKYFDSYGNQFGCILNDIFNTKLAEVRAQHFEIFNRLIDSFKFNMPAANANLKDTLQFESVIVIASTNETNFSQVQATSASALKRRMHYPVTLRRLAPYDSRVLGSINKAWMFELNYPEWAVENNKSSGWLASEELRHFLHDNDPEKLAILMKTGRVSLCFAEITQSIAEGIYRKIRKTNDLIFSDGMLLYDHRDRVRVMKEPTFELCSLDNSKEKENFVYYDSKNHNWNMAPYVEKYLLNRMVHVSPEQVDKELKPCRCGSL